MADYNNQQPQQQFQQGGDLQHLQQQQFGDYPQQPLGPNDSQISLASDVRFWVAVINTPAIVSFPITFASVNVDGLFTKLWIIFILLMMVAQTALGFASICNVMGVRNKITKYQTNGWILAPSEQTLQTIRIIIQVVPAAVNGLSVGLLTIVGVVLLYTTGSDDEQTHLFHSIGIGVIVLAVFLILPTILSAIATKWEMAAYNECQRYHAPAFPQQHMGMPPSPQQQGQYQPPHQPQVDAENPQQPFIQQ